MPSALTSQQTSRPNQLKAGAPSAWFSFVSPEAECHRLTPVKSCYLLVFVILIKIAPTVACRLGLSRLKRSAQYIIALRLILCNNYFIVHQAKPGPIC